jgi:hypothetical protein
MPLRRGEIADSPIGLPPRTECLPLEHLGLRLLGFLLRLVEKPLRPHELRGQDAEPEENDQPAGAGKHQQRDSRDDEESTDDRDADALAVSCEESGDDLERKNDPVVMPASLPGETLRGELGDRRVRVPFGRVIAPDLGSSPHLAFPMDDVARQSATGAAVHSSRRLRLVGEGGAPHQGEAAQMPIQSSPESSPPDPESPPPPDPELSSDPPSSLDPDPELSSDPLPSSDPEPSEDPESSEPLELDSLRSSPPSDTPEPLPPWSSPSASRPGLRVGTSSD